MSNTKIQDQLKTLFQDHFSTSVEQIDQLPRSGSDRQYFRLHGKTQTAIGAYNPDLRENQAFVGFSRHFYDKKIAVPEVYAADLSQHIYLQQDLGNRTLFQQLQAARESDTFPDAVIPLYKKAIDQLAHLQIEGGKGLDYDLCYPKAAFDRQSILWDLNYFKYYFLKLSKTTFDEQALEDDFHRFADVLLDVDGEYFMFRDFQSRNIMLQEDQVWFIDYQGGRKGALQYDLASLLWQAKANLPYPLREELLDYYVQSAQRFAPLQPAEFVQNYYAFVLVRCLQVLGAYGFRGLYEGREHFISSIPFALDNLEWLLNHAPLPDLPVLRDALERMLSNRSKDFRHKTKATTKDLGKELTVRVFSFSYKHGYPEDKSGHGGGFAFDCRSIHNPGRYEPYKKLTGRDESVKRFLQEKSEIKSFLSHSFAMVDKAVETYLSRNFTYLSVGFGCTGGQHRSVYSADSLAQHLEQKYGVTVQLEHIEQEAKGWVN